MVNRPPPILPYAGEMLVASNGEEPAIMLRDVLVYHVYIKLRIQYKDICMGSNTRSASLFIILVSGLFLMGTLWVAAQDSSNDPGGATCEPVLNAFYTTASAVCLGKSDGYFCNAGSPPSAEPAGPVSSSLATLGALVPVDAVDVIHTPGFSPDGSTGGLVWMRVQNTTMRGLLVGDVRVRDVTPVDQGFPKWTSMVVETAQSAPGCAAAPLNSFIVQSNVPFEQIASTRVVVNGVSVDLRGTVMVQTSETETIFVALEGEVRIISSGQTQGMVAGQEIRVAHELDDYSRALGEPSFPTPFTSSLVQNFPVALLDRPTILPQPGYVVTEGAVNLRASPTLNGALLFQVPPGQIMTILGRNPAGDWYHVRLTTGETGWMFAELLRRSHGDITTVYEATPVPPQRFGDLGTKARVLAQSGVTMRSAPDAGFSAVASLDPAAEVSLLARSPYSPWVKVDAAGTVGWVALITLDTQSIVSSLPVDYDVPPPPVPPPPTRVPGSWGGAFPDPSCYPNC